MSGSPGAAPRFLVRPGYVLAGVTCAMWARLVIGIETLPVPSGSIAPCIGHDVYRRSLPLGHDWAPTSPAKPSPNSTTATAAIREALMAGPPYSHTLIGSSVEMAGMRLWRLAGCQRAPDDRQER